jgi:cytidylate kinase
MTGSLGRGKSTVCKQLTERFGLQYFSTGVIQRGLAVKMGMTTYELNKYSETHPEIDEMIDGELKKLSDLSEDMVIDSRMAWHFVRDTYNVFLMTDETVAAERVMAASRGPSEGYADTEQARALLKARRVSENSRYLSTYGVDCDDLLNYDLVVDTTNDASVVSPEYIAHMIMENYLRRKPRESGPALFISPLCLYPTQLAPDDAPQVRVVVGGDFIFIREGHGRVREYCRAERPLVPCGLAAGGGEGGLFDAETVRAWERENGFRFRTYPV